MKIKMNPIVEMDGDEMTRVLWKMIKEELIEPFVELNTEYYDLSLPNRDATDDEVTVAAAEAVKRLKVGVKCATITPNAQRMEEYGLKQMWKSPNATIRAALDGTVFRKPIITSRIKPYVRGWTEPITIARHAYGDVYKAVELRVPEGGRAELVLSGEKGEERREIYTFKGPGVIQGMHNRDDSITGFARACFEYALDLGQDLWFSSKDTISKVYDGRFRDIFEQVYQQQYKQRFEKAGIKYFYTLIDDAVARVIRSEGGFVWACKNYDGDVMSDMVSTAFGSLAMMTSVLVSPEGCYEYEAAHGTVTRHYYRWLKGEKTSTNPIATIFAWSGALRKRGELDGSEALRDFAGRLEKASLAVIDEGVMTADLAALCTEEVKTADSAEFIGEIRKLLEK
ncbi:MAG: NADP-dependent isocitrate dehydrogenase [Oscillospiraceae bacterium]|nr:NADP-dependent isocitrate dehydrogenase [Oscillospiraceae bacterium]